MYEMKDFGGSLGRVGSRDNLSNWASSSKGSRSSALYSPVIKRVHSEGNSRRALIWKKKPGEVKGKKLRHSHELSGWLSSPPSPQPAKRFNNKFSVGSTSHFARHTNLCSATSVPVPCKSVCYMPQSCVVWPPVVPTSTASDSAEKCAFNVNTVLSRTEVYALHCKHSGRSSLNKCSREGNECSPSAVWPVTHHYEQRGQRSFKHNEDLQFTGCVPLGPQVYPPSPPRSARYSPIRPDHSGPSYSSLQMVENWPELDAVNRNRPPVVKTPPSPFITYYAGSTAESPGLPPPFLHQPVNLNVFVSDHENAHSMGYSPTSYKGKYPCVTESPGLHYHSLQEASKTHPSYSSFNDATPSVVHSTSMFAAVYPQTRSQSSEEYYYTQEPTDSKTEFNSSNRSDELFEPQIGQSQQYPVMTTGKSTDSFSNLTSASRQEENFELCKTSDQSSYSWSPSSHTPPAPVIQLSSGGSASDDSQSNISSPPSSSCLCSQCMSGGLPSSPHKSPRKNWSLRMFLLDRMLASSPYSSLNSTASLGSRGSLGDV